VGSSIYVVCQGQLHEEKYTLFFVEAFDRALCQRGIRKSQNKIITSAFDENHKQS
jgi:hypothetical protein